MPGGIAFDWEPNLFIGMPMFLAGLSGLFSVRDRNIRGLLGLALVAIVVGLGNSTPLFGLFYKWLPGYSSFRSHVRMGLLVVLALLCSAGIWLSKPHPWLRALLSPVTGLRAKYLFGLFIFLQIGRASCRERV